MKNCAYNRHPGFIGKRFHHNANTRQVGRIMQRCQGNELFNGHHGQIRLHEYLKLERGRPRVEHQYFHLLAFPRFMIFIQFD